MACWDCNQMKGTMSFSKIQMFYKKMKPYR